MKSKIQIVEQYFALVSAFSNDRAAYDALLHPQMTETEYPNLLSPRLRQRSVDDGMKGIALSGQLLKFQRYDVRHWVEGGETLAVEVTWTGELRIDAGRLKKDQALKAEVCFVFQFREGKIHQLRHYDCYDPF